MLYGSKMFLNIASTLFGLSSCVHCKSTIIQYCHDATTNSCSVTNLALNSAASGCSIETRYSTHCLLSVTWTSSGNVTRVLLGCYQGVTRALLGRCNQQQHYKGVTKVTRMLLVGFTWMLIRCYQGVTTHLSSVQKVLQESTNKPHQLSFLLRLA